MLTKLKIRNFKKFKDVSIDLGNPVVFIGPNNSGKTTALQTLALWNVGVKRWLEKYGDDKVAVPTKRPGVTINRQDILALPVSNARLLWHNLSVRAAKKNNGERDGTENIRIEIEVEGVTNGEAWECGLEFDYANAESFYCKPLVDPETNDRKVVPDASAAMSVAFLPPMSGLADREFMKQPGEIGFLIGQGKTADVLRNLCFALTIHDGDNRWNSVSREIHKLFGIRLHPPRFIFERGEIELLYDDQNGVKLDITSAGRGLHQTLLLLAYLANNPSSVLLLDEPDAHLEILRQREIYQSLSEIARQQDSQVIIASHSEVLLNEAADRDVVIAFVGEPHRIDDRHSQVAKSLKQIGFEHYYQAQQTGWVLYLEGSTDLAMLRAFAQILEHSAVETLKQPFVHYIGNQPSKAREHFYGLVEAKSDLKGFALFDNLDMSLQQGDPSLRMHMWAQREFENYLCYRETLLSWAEQEFMGRGTLFSFNWRKVMSDTIDEIEDALTRLDKSPWSQTIKASDDFLDPLFKRFYAHLKIPNIMQKQNYHVLAPFVPRHLILPEIIVVLDLIWDTQQKANALQVP